MSEDKTPNAMPIQLLFLSVSENVPIKNPTTTNDHAIPAFRDGRRAVVEKETRMLNGITKARTNWISKRLTLKSVKLVTPTLRRKESGVGRAQSVAGERY